MAISMSPSLLTKASSHHTFAAPRAERNVGFPVLDYRRLIRSHWGASLSDRLNVFGISYLLICSFFSWTSAAIILSLLYFARLILLLNSVGSRQDLTDLS